MKRSLVICCYLLTVMASFGQLYCSSEEFEECYGKPITAQLRIVSGVPVTVTSYVYSNWVVVL